MKLEVGMFLRTMYGFYKISRIVLEGTNDEYYHCNLREDDEGGSVWTSILKEEIVNASKRIVNLLNSGDYVLVEGEIGFRRITYINTEYEDEESLRRTFYFSKDKENGCPHYNEEIIAVLPKEYFEQGIYKVGE